MLASRRHWRLLVGTIVLLMGAALLAPRWIPAPQLAENRVLAPAPSLPDRPGQFRAFRKAVDDYVADHFPSRPHLIGALNRLRMLARVSGSERVIVGRDGWLFFDNGTHLGAVRNDPPMAPEHIRAWLSTVAGSTEAMRARGGVYLVVVPPVKEAIYPQYGPAWYGGPSPDRPALALPKLAREAGAGEVLYLYDPVAAATRRGEATYSRHDTHWSGYGAYAGYVGLVRKLQAMGALKEGPLPLSAFTQIRGGESRGPRDLALMLGVASFVDLDYPHFDYPQGQARARVTYLSHRRDWTGPMVIDTGEAGKPVLLMTRDSFSKELVPFLFPHFSRLVLAHNQDGAWRQDLVERYSPDIVIVEVVEPGLPVALGAGPPASPEAIGRIEAAVPRLQPPATSHLPRLSRPSARMLATLEGAGPAERCNLEAATLVRGQGTAATLTVGGWVADFESGLRSPNGVLRLQGPGVDISAPIRVDNPRPDVAAYFKQPAAEKSGFAGAFAAPALPPGPYTVTVYRHSWSGWSACVGPQPVTAP